MSVSLAATPHPSQNLRQLLIEGFSMKGNRVLLRAVQADYAIPMFKYRYRAIIRKPYENVPMFALSFSYA